MNDNVHFGKRVAELRRELDLLQEDLAIALSASQSSISRIEAAARPPTDPRVLARLAKVLDSPLSDLLHGVQLPDSLSTELGDSFWAFCPNPICHRNTLKDTPEGARINWSSWTEYEANDFETINFCLVSGDELVKQCPSCEKPLIENRTKYCVTCGAKIADRPTSEEWSEIRKAFKEAKEKSELPF